MTKLTRIDKNREIHPPRGTELSCRNWLIEAPYWIIQHNLHPAVSEHPAAIVFHGGIGRAARTWDCLDSLLALPRILEEAEPLPV